MSIQIKPALHRVQDLGAQMVNLYLLEEFKGDVSAYLNLRDLQLDAQEDDDYDLAKSIGRSMREIREKYDSDKWEKELNLQDS